MFVPQGRFSQSAKYYKEVAEVCEADENLASAMDFYQKAADLYNNDNKAQAGAD